MGFPVVIVAMAGNGAEIALKWEMNCRLKIKYFVKLQQGIRKNGQTTWQTIIQRPKEVLQPTHTSTDNVAHQLHVIAVNYT